MSSTSTSSSFGLGTDSTGPRKSERSLGSEVVLWLHSPEDTPGVRLEHKSVASEKRRSSLPAALSPATPDEMASTPEHDRPRPCRVCRRFLPAQFFAAVSPRHRYKQCNLCRVSTWGSKPQTRTRYARLRDLRTQPCVVCGRRSTLEAMLLVTKDNHDVLAPVSLFWRYLKPDAFEQALADSVPCCRSCKYAVRSKLKYGRKLQRMFDLANFQSLAMGGPDLRTLDLTSE